MTSPLLIAASLLVVACLAVLTLAGDGMAACQVHHSFEVCHDAIH